MEPAPVSAPLGASVAAVLGEAVDAEPRSAYPIVEGGRLLGVVPADRIGGVPAPESRGRALAELMIPAERRSEPSRLARSAARSR
jgi:hypothetical protein